MASMLSELRRKANIEEGNGFKKGLVEAPQHLNLSTIGSGLTAAAFGLTGVPLILIAAAEEGGLSSAETVSWIFAVYAVGGGLVGFSLALYYQRPLVGAWTIPGAAMLGPILANFDLRVAAGAYLISGVAVLLLGLSGLFGKVVEMIPTPIIMGMIAGVLIDFSIDIVSSIQSSVVIAGAGMIGFLLFSRFFERVPGIIGAIILGTVVAIYQGATGFGGVEFTLAQPMFITPAFSLGSMVSVAVPITVMVIGAENMQAIGVLEAEEYDAPVNSMLTVSGIGGMITAFFGGHNANVAGPSTAIAASDMAGPREGRYVAALICSFFYAAFGVLAGSAVAFSNALPGDLISLLAGIAMIPVLISAFESSFGDTVNFRYGAFFAVIIGMSGVALFDIGAAFWALVGGIAISLVLETDDWT